MRLHTFLLALYPGSWRARYEDEFTDLLEQRPPTCSDILNIVYGAFDAHLHPQFGTAYLSPSEKSKLLLRALRGSLISVFYAYIGFIVVGCLFAKMTEEGFGQVTQASTLLFTLYALVFAGSIIALLAMLIGGLPVIVAVIWQAIANHRIRPLLMLAMPFLAFAALLLFIHMHKAPVPRIVAQISFAAFFLAMATLSTTAVSGAIARSDIQPALLRFATPLAAIGTGAMLLMLIGTVGWGLSLHVNHPDLFLNYHGFMDMNVVTQWILTTCGMTLSAAFAGMSILRGIRSSALLTTES